MPPSHEILVFDGFDDDSSVVSVACVNPHALACSVLVHVLVPFPKGPSLHYKL